MEWLGRIRLVASTVDYLELLKWMRDTEREVLRLRESYRRLSDRYDEVMREK